MATSTTATAYVTSDSLSMDAPYGVAVDSINEKVCVCDTGNDTVYLAYAEGLASDTSLTSYDSNDFTNPHGICYWGGYFYVCDSGGHTLVRIRSRDLSYKDHFGTNGSAGDSSAGKLNVPEDVTTDGEHLYIVESGVDRVTKLDMDLAYVDSSTAFGSYSISGAKGITVSLSGGKSLYISDTGNQRVLMIGKDWTYKDNVGTIDPAGSCFYNDMLHVCDSVDDDVKVYDAATLTLRTTISTTTSSLDTPYGIDCWRGALYIADSVNDTVKVWKRYDPVDAVEADSGAIIGTRILVGVDSVVVGATGETSPNRWFEEDLTFDGVGWSKEAIALSDPGWSKE